MSEREPIQSIVHLVEYFRLKEEQLRRIADRDHLLYANLVSVAAVWAFALEHQEHAYVLLALPVVCFVLGTLHLANDAKISAIGRYVTGPLQSEFNEVNEVERQKLFGWEAFHRTERDRSAIKLLELVGIALVFVFSGFSGLAFVFFSSASRTTLINIVSAIGLVLLLILLVEIFREAKRANSHRAH
jgi:heme A synthase